MNPLKEANEYTKEGNLSGLIEMPEPSRRYFTPIYNDYIKAGGKSKMTKEEALKHWEFLAGFGGKSKAQGVIHKVVRAQKIVFKKILKDGLSKAEAIQMARNAFPLEALFKFLPR